jgi:hypothetical protein
LALTDYFQAVKTAEGPAPFLAVLRSAFKAPKISKTKSKTLSEKEVVEQTQAAFQAFVREQEAVRLLDFALTRSQRSVFVKAPSGNDEEASFLGYKFSERRGYEGLIKINPNAEDQVDGALYNEQAPHDPDRVSGVLHAAFGGTFRVPATLSGTTQIVDLASLIKFDRATYIAEIGSPPFVVPKSSLHKMVNVGDLAAIIQGRVVPTYAKNQKGSGNRLVSSGMIGNLSVDISKAKLLDVSVVVDLSKQLKNGDILMGAVAEGTAGRVGVYRSNGQHFTGDNTLVIRPDPVVVVPDYLATVLDYVGPEGIARATGNEGYSRMGMKAVSALTVPLPPLVEQQKIVVRARRLRTVAEGRQQQADAAFQQSLTVVDGPFVPLSSLVSVVAERTAPSEKPSTVFNLVEMEHIEAGTGKGKAIQKAGGKINGARSVFQKGDVLYGRLSPGQKKVWVADTDGICSPELLVLRPASSGSVVATLLLNDNLAAIAKGLEKGTSQKRISVDDLLSLQVPDPIPKLTQHTASIANLAVRRATMEAKANTAKNRLAGFLKSALGL